MEAPPLQPRDDCDDYDGYVMIQPAPSPAPNPGSNPGSLPSAGPLTDAGGPAPPRFGWRARLLLAMERWFPVVQAPTDADAGEHARYEYAKAAGSFARAIDELGGSAALADKTVLDFGCGWGGETAWLAQRVGQAIGCDIDPHSLHAAEAFQWQRSIPNLRFHLIRDGRIPLPDAGVDAVLSTNVFEHVMQPAAMLAEIHRVLRPGGRFITTFGPLFHSPRGYHLCWATQAPWAHLIFGRDAVIAVRNTRRTPIAPRSWEDTGLNRITFRRFAAAVHNVGLQIVRLRRIPVRGCGPLARVPLLGDLVTFGIDAHLRRPEAT
jgi:SAM-dependent methyltransferase